MMKSKNKKKGFTLIELIIVIAIIAILAAIAVPKFGEVRESARRKSDLANAKNIHSAVAILVTEGTVKKAESSEKIKECYLNGTEGDATSGDKNMIATEETAIKNYLQSLPMSEVDQTKYFTVTIDETGTVVVKVGDSKVYPE